MTAATTSRGGASQIGRFVGRLVRRQGGTPARLRALLSITVILAILLGVLGAFGVNRRSQAIGDMQASAAQLIDVQSARVTIVRADAIASSSYLVGGQEDPVQRAAYDTQVAEASRYLVSVANRVSSSDAATLTQVSTALNTYVGLVEQARANNRQGFPLGAAYQRQANALVTQGSDASPSIVALLRTVEDSQRQRVNSGLQRAHRAGFWMISFGVILVAALLCGCVFLLRSFNRVVNVPLAIAAVVVLVVLLVGGSVQGTAVSKADDAVAGPLTQADLIAQGRAAAFDARSQEALTLINRGNGTANEAKWQFAATTTRQALSQACARVPDGCGQAPFDEYQTAHEALRILDDGGNWDGAVAADLGSGNPALVPGSVVVPFDQFVTESGDQVTSAAASASAALSDARSSLGALRVLVFLVGLVVAALAFVGYDQRIREYR